jgi:glucose/arabinose dehydrogenase
MFASLPEAGLVYCLERQNTPDKNGAEVKTAPNLWSRRIFCSDLDRPMGLAAHDGYLYVATRTGVVKLPIPESFTQKTGSIETFVTDLPPAYASEYRPLSIAPDGSAYLSVGAGDAGPQRSEWQRAGVLRIAPDGNTELYATGLHDVRALIHHPLTKALWALENSPETLDLHPPPDEINIVREGGDYGWPFCYGIKVPDKDLGTTTICAATDAPVALFPPYSNPTGLAFGTHLDAPKRYRSMLYVALQGQDDGTHLNRFRIVGLPLNENGALSGLGVDMLSALAPSAHRAARPAALCASPSGNLYLGDTCSGVVYRFIFPSDADHHLDLPRGENTSANNGQDTNTEKDRN